MKLQEFNSNMLECVNCRDVFQDGHDLMVSILNGVFTSSAVNKISFMDDLNEIQSQLSIIEESYINLGLISEDGTPFDDEMLSITKVERKIANGKISVLEDIPESLRSHFARTNEEFEAYREELADSEGIWSEINSSREIIDGIVESLGEQPFEELLSGVNANVDKLASNLDELFSDYIKSINKFAYLF